MEQKMKILLNLKAFFEKEKSMGKPWYITNIIRRMTVATGLPRCTLTRIINNGTKKTILMKPTSRCKIDNFDQGVIRRVINSMNGRNQHLTLRSLAVGLEENDIFISKSTLHRIVLKMGFRFYKSGLGKRFIKERLDVVCSRHRYLREVRKARMEGDAIVYLDETWVNVNHCMKGEWSDSCESLTSRMTVNEKGAGKFVPSGKGKRLIVLDAGCKDVGLIPGVGEVFVAKNDNGDYHSEMNHKHFLDCWKNTLLPALPGPSTIVVDNASYHSVMTDESRSPTTATRKDDIKIWLQHRHIQFTDDMVKAELLDIVKRNKPRPKYIIDELAMEAGHKVLRLPPRHCELNPIELVLAKMKGYVARNNSSFKLSNTMSLFKESKALITPEYWNRCEEHVITKVESELWRVDGVREDEIAPVVVSIGEDDATDIDEYDTDDDSDDDENDGQPLPDRTNITVRQELINVIHGENDDECKCYKCGKREPGNCSECDLEWICCDACERWFHCYCVGITNVNLIKSFFCTTCERIFTKSY